jgi:hypothetical protein
MSPSGQPSDIGVAMALHKYYEVMLFTIFDTKQMPKD